MKITVDFNSLEEINEFCNGVLIVPEISTVAREARMEEKPKKTTPKKGKAKEEPQTKPEEAPTAEEPVEETSTEAEEAPAEVEEPAAESVHSDKDLKMFLSDKLKAGKKKEVKELFSKYGVSCLTDLIAKEKDNIDAVYAEAEVI